jgi:hypothetical protein
LAPPRRTVVRAPDGSAIFSKQPLEQILTDRESCRMAMLYRERVEFAAGHHVSVLAEKSPDDPTCAVRIETEFLPTFEVPKVTPPRTDELEGLEGLELSMKSLALIRQDTVARALGPLTAAYEIWIRQLEDRIQSEASLQRFQKDARETLDGCRETLRRIQAGIDLLERDPLALEAFQFMNEAMYRQRVRSLFAAARRREEDVVLSQFERPELHRWYPFRSASSCSTCLRSRTSTTRIVAWTRVPSPTYCSSRQGAARPRRISG